MTSDHEEAKPSSRTRTGFAPGHSGNPAQLWQPGKSGNPSGRPSAEREVTLAARALVLEGIQALAGVMRNSRAPAVARVRAVEVILERAYGKAPQRVVVENDTAGMSNEALASYMRGTLEQMARTIEHEPDGDSDK